MGKFLKVLLKIVCATVVLAVVGVAVFYFTRKEKFLSFNDFLDELSDTLATLPVVALLF